MCGLLPLAIAFTRFFNGFRVQRNDRMQGGAGVRLKFSDAVEVEGRQVLVRHAASGHVALKGGDVLLENERRKLGVPVFTKRTQRLFKRRPELIFVLKLRLNQLVAHAHILVLGVGGKGR